MCIKLVDVTVRKRSKLEEGSKIVIYALRDEKYFAMTTELFVCKTSVIVKEEC